MTSRVIGISCWAVFIVLLSSAAVRADAEVWAVPGRAPTIQAGIDSAAVGDTVLVTGGTYYEHVHFNGKDIVLTAVTTGERPTIHGGGTGTPVTFDGGESARAIIEGFRITGSWASAENHGIAILGASPTIRSCVITGNGAEVWGPARGGGIYAVNGSAPHIVGNEIVSNGVVTAPPYDDAQGGGIYLHSATGLRTRAEIRDNLITGNRSVGGRAKGGGIYVSVVTPSDCRISNNRVLNNTADGSNGESGKGGGIYANCVVDLNTVTDCIAESPLPYYEGSAYGGGIYLSSAGASASGNRVTGCRARSVAGYAVDGNHAAGGGIYSFGSLKSNVVARNTATVERSSGYQDYMFVEGGGVYCTGASFRGNTVFENQIDRVGDLGWGQASGAGVFLGSSTAAAKNIVAGNSFLDSGGAGGGFYSGASFSCNDVYGNAPNNYAGVADPTGSNGNISLDPMFCHPDTLDLAISKVSPCAPGMSGFCQLIGACAVGCGPPPDADLADRRGSPGVFLGAPRPNPARSSSAVHFTLASPGHVTVEVFDVAGRRVRALLDADLGEGGHSVVWDGRNDAGREVAGGVYAIRVEAGGASEVGRLVRLR